MCHVVLPAKETRENYKEEWKLGGNLYEKKN
jgi:hypothetical protein